MDQQQRIADTPMTPYQVAQRIHFYRQADNALGGPVAARVWFAEIDEHVALFDLDGTLNGRRCCVEGHASETQAEQHGFERCQAGYWV